MIIENNCKKNNEIQIELNRIDYFYLSNSFKYIFAKIHGTLCEIHAMHTVQYKMKYWILYHIMQTVMRQFMRQYRQIIHGQYLSYRDAMHL